MLLIPLISMCRSEPHGLVSDFASYFKSTDPNHPVLDQDC